MKKLLTLCLAGLTAAVFASETAVELTKQNVIGWGPNTYYQTKPVVTAENGVGKVTCGKLVEGAKIKRYQFSVCSTQLFKAGVKYTISFTVKSNREIKKAPAYFQGHERPCPIFAKTVITLPADTERPFEITCTPKKDIAVKTRLVSIHMPLKEDQTLEIGKVKITEE